MSSQVSIVIPTLNEENYLERTLRNLTHLNPTAKEILIVDGGSKDNTLKIAKKAGLCPIIADRAGRSIQMNLGAKAAKGEILCFLHADTLVPDDLVVVIEKTLSDSTIACGGFISLMTGKLNTRWSFSFNNYLKTYYAPLLFRPHLFFGKGLRVIFGDQVMFCRRQDFLDCGGFDPELPILEDANLGYQNVFNLSGSIFQWVNENRLVYREGKQVNKVHPYQKWWGCLLNEQYL